MAVPFIFMQDLQEFFPYKNTAMLDKQRALKWTNEALLEAVRFYKDVHKVEISTDVVLAELKESKLRAIQALLYGAAKAESPTLTIEQFSRIYKPENLLEYVSAVLDGMVHYYPAADNRDTGEDLDQEWPDTQTEVKKKSKKKDRTGVTGSGSAKK